MGTCVIDYLVRCLTMMIVAADPRLTAIGEEQARNAHAAWRREINRGVPVPQTFYCSLLSRALRTLELTFEGILPTNLKPIILEVTSHTFSCGADLLTFGLRTAVKSMVNTVVTSVGHDRR